MTTYTYAEAVEHVKNGDVLLFRGKGLISWAIKRFGKGRHSHVAMVFKENNECITYEFREFVGWRRRPLIEQVLEFPNQIDVFRPMTSVTSPDGITRSWDEKRQSVAAWYMRSWAGKRYGWKNIALLAFHYLPVGRLFPVKDKDDEPTDVYVCSTAVGVALRKSYLDPCPSLSDVMVTPTDIARSALLAYEFSIEEST